MRASGLRNAHIRDLTVEAMPVDIMKYLCVPETPSVSCDLRVFVDDTADQIASPDSEGVEVNGAAGSGLSGAACPSERCGRCALWWFSYSRSTRRRCR